jgi:hypothetical protein
MTPEQRLAVMAVQSLSSLAADFKMGIVSNDYIRSQLFNAFVGLGLDAEQVVKEIKTAMISWGEWGDDEDYLDSNAHLDQVE